MQSHPFRTKDAPSALLSKEITGVWGALYQEAGQRPIHIYIYIYIYIYIIKYTYFIISHLSIYYTFTFTTIQSFASWDEISEGFGRESFKNLWNS